MSDPQNAYCISCGETVSLEKVDLGIEGEELFRCKQCGAYLGTRKSLEKLDQELENPQAAIPAPVRIPRPGTPLSGDFHSETSSVSEGPIPEVPADTAPASSFPAQAEEEEVFQGDTPPIAGMTKIDTIVFAEDTELVARILQDMIVQKGLSRRVIYCKNGFEFVINYLKSRGQDTMIGLIILDVIMPVLNGISAAVAIRAWEKALKLEPVPILFFTAKRCDDTFKRVLQHTSPSMYINKGASDSAAQLETRIDRVINQLLKEAL